MCWNEFRHQEGNLVQVAENAEGDWRCGVRSEGLESEKMEGVSTEVCRGSEW
jgi:hypothetical protein